MRDVTDLYKFPESKPRTNSPKFELIFNGRIWELTPEDLSVNRTRLVSLLPYSDKSIRNHMISKLKLEFSRRDAEGRFVYQRSVRDRLRIEPKRFCKAGEIILYVQKLS